MYILYYANRNDNPAGLGETSLQPGVLSPDCAAPAALTVYNLHVAAPCKTPYSAAHAAYSLWQCAGTQSGAITRDTLPVTSPPAALVATIHGGDSDTTDGGHTALPGALTSQLQGGMERRREQRRTVHSPCNASSVSSYQNCSKGRTEQLPMATVLEWLLWATTARVLCSQCDPSPPMCSLIYTHSWGKRATLADYGGAHGSWDGLG